MPTESSKKHRIIAILAAVISLCVMLIVYGVSADRDFRREQNRYAFIAEDEATHISTTIDCIMTRTNTLEILLQDHNGDGASFETIAEKMYNNVIKETGVALKNLAIAPGGIVSQVYPYKGNEALIGFDFMDLSKPGNLEAKEAYEKGETILTNPFELVQGGIGMAGRKPVFLDSDDGKILWGLVTVTIDFPNLLKVLHFENVSGRNIDYEFSYLDGDGEKHIIQSFGHMSRSCVRKQFAIRNLTWEIAIEPSGGWIPLKHTIVFIILFVTLSHFVGMFTNVFLKLRSSNAQLLELSITDKLTGCYNRRAYETDFSTFQDNPPDNDFVYVAADINGLKTANDTLGHFVGDELISGMADCLKKCFDNYGKVYRTGGDEFVAMISVEAETLPKIAAMLKEEVANWKGKNIDKLSVSVGYAEKRDNPYASVNDLAKKADRNMYGEKYNFYAQKGVDRRHSDKRDDNA